jgi:hypothetical protein
VTTCTCGCCAGTDRRTPTEVGNRPGLSAVTYRVGTHPELLASMIADLPTAGRGTDDTSDPDDDEGIRGPLAELTTRDRDDLSLALLDAWAVIGDILTFYSERLAQESWLRTATDRRSLQELGRLVGHRMAPGVAAQTHLAFAVTPPPDVPAAAKQEPGSAPPVTPPWVEVPVGLRVQSIPGPGQQPQTFETVAFVTARPEHNAIRASTSALHVPTTGDTTAWLAGGALGLRAGDLLLFVGDDILDDRWDVREIAAVQPEPAADRTEVSWVNPLGSTYPVKAAADDPDAYLLRERLDVFGHNAPSWSSMGFTFRSAYAGSDHATHDDWPAFQLSPASGQVVDLAGSHPGIVVGSWLVLVRPNYRELFRVAAVTELSRAQFAISGKVTRVTLTGGENFSLFDTLGAPREVSVWAVSDPVDLVDAPDPTPVDGSSIVVDGDLDDLEPGTTVIVAGRTTDGDEHAEVAVVDAVAAAGPGRRRIAFARDLDGTYVRDTVLVHANVALATHGETISELLGSGRGARTFQRFALAQGPLTHVEATTPSGTASTLEVRVNDVAWHEVRSHHGGGAEDHTYVIARAEDGGSIVAFGDGVRGARLPTGTNNVRARYRKGIGTAGNVGVGTLAQLLDRPLGLRGVTNPLPASGGAEPESAAEARRTIPQSVRTLGRAVSLLDYEDLALTFPGVRKARASVLPLPGGRTIVTTVALDPGTGANSSSRLENLATSFRTYGDPHVQVAVVEQHTERFRLALTVSLDPRHDDEVVLTALRDTLHRTFGFDHRELVEPVHASQVVAVAHSVAGIVGCRVDRLYRAGDPPQRLERLTARSPAVTGGVVLPAGLLLLDDDPLDWLQVAP